MRHQIIRMPVSKTSRTGDAGIFQGRAASIRSRFAARRPLEQLASMPKAQATRARRSTISGSRAGGSPQLGGCVAQLIFDRAIALIETIGAAGEAKYLDFVLTAFASMVQLGEFDKANTHLPRVMELARRSGKPALICGTLSQMGMICWFEGRYREGLRATEEGLAIARTLQSPALIYANSIMQTNILHAWDGCGARSPSSASCANAHRRAETARLGAASCPAPRRCPSELVPSRHRRL